MNILVLVNPFAGNGKTLKKMEKIKCLLEKNPHDFSWKITGSPDEMRAHILRAGRDSAHMLLLMGGDGTVHAALSAIQAARLPFGLLPCGRGNDFARNIGLPLDLSHNGIIAAEPVYQTLDLPFLNDRPFGSIACTGFDAEVNKLARDKQGYFGGTLGYIICVVRALRSYVPFEAEVRVGDDVWQGRIMMVAVSNGAHYGGGMKITPEARMNDGKFDVCIIEEVSKWELIREFPKVFQGKHTAHPKVHIFRGVEVEIHSDEKREIYADGEYMGDLPCTARIGHKHIQVLGVSAERPA